MNIKTVGDILMFVHDTSWDKVVEKEIAKVKKMVNYNILTLSMNETNSLTYTALSVNQPKSIIFTFVHVWFKLILDIVHVL